MKIGLLLQASTPAIKVIIKISVIIKVINKHAIRYSEFSSIM